MTALTFKTNIKCASCEATVTPFLNQAVGVGNWAVDTLVKDKVLTVSNNTVAAQEVVAALQQAGYKGEQI